MGHDPGAKNYGMKADPLRFKCECFLLKGWRNILLREALTKNSDVM